MTVKRKELDQETKKELFLWVLAGTNNNVSKACEVSGVGRSTYYDWLEDDETFADNVHHVKEAKIDWVEERQDALIRSLDGPQIRFFLNAQAKRRGYGDQRKTIHEYPDGLPAPEQHLHLHMPPMPKTLAEWEGQVREMRANRQLPEKTEDIQEAEVIDEKTEALD